MLGRQPVVHSYAETFGDFYPAYARGHVRAQKTTIRGFICQSPYRCESQVDEPISADKWDRLLRDAKICYMLVGQRSRFAAHHVFGHAVTRATYDLDFATLVDSWEQFVRFRLSAV